MRIFIAATLLLASLAAAHAFGLGREGRIFGRLGAYPKGGVAAAPTVCANDAPDGTVDLSKCSNLFYVAVIF